jgi:uncharacterized protein
MLEKAGALVVAAAALSAALVAVALPADAADPDVRRGLTVTGTNVVQVAPDTAEWSFGVHARSSTARAAVRTATSRMRAIVASVRKAGVARADVRTDHVALYPRIDEEGGAVDGYVASTTVRAVVRNLARAGAVVEAAVGAGATEVYGPSLTRSDAAAQYRLALERAYDDARAKAERMAAKVGVSLGAPTAIVEGPAAGEPVHADAALAEGAAEVALEPGPDRNHGVRHGHVRDRVGDPGGVAAAGHSLRSVV